MIQSGAWSDFHQVTLSDIISAQMMHIKHEPNSPLFSDIEWIVSKLPQHLHCNFLTITFTQRVSQFNYVLNCSDYPTMCRLQRLHSGPIHPEGVGPPVAHRVPQMLRLRDSPGRQVFRQRG